MLKSRSNLGKRFVTNINNWGKHPNRSSCCHGRGSGENWISEFVYKKSPIRIMLIGPVVTLHWLSLCCCRRPLCFFVGCISLRLKSHYFGASAFYMEYARWLDDHQRLINDVRSALNTHMLHNELRLLVEAVMSHYDEIFRLKRIAAKSDVFHMLSGMWKSPAERCFMWIGGFHSSELLKILGNHLEPLTDQQLMGICNLQQSSSKQKMRCLKGWKLCNNPLLTRFPWVDTSSVNVADYMGQMAIAMGKLATLENFLHQADLLRQQTLQQLHRILTTRQAATALLVISDYMARLPALSSLWLARPKD